MEYFSSWRWPRLVGPVQPLAPGRFPSATEANRPWRVKRRLADERARIGFQQSIPGIPGTSRADIWLERINDVWRTFHGSDATRIDIELVEPTGEDEGLQADLFVMRGRERVCSVDRLGAGELELLSLADWFILRDARDGDVLPVATVHVTAADVELALGWHHVRCVEPCDNGGWRRDFSGKEILNAAVTSIWRTGRPPTARRDLLMMVAERQRRSAALPPEIVELHEALRARAGLAPRPL